MFQKIDIAGGTVFQHLRLLDKVVMFTNSLMITIWTPKPVYTQQQLTCPECNGTVLRSGTEYTKVQIVGFQGRKYVHHVGHIPLLYRTCAVDPNHDFTQLVDAEKSP